MTRVLRQHWRRAARGGPRVLRRGEDCCFLTLGDALLYSTYIYLLRELQAIDPAVPVVTVPGITAFSAAAALANRPVGEGKQLVTIVPALDDLDQFAAALDCGGTVVLMKIGQRLDGPRRVGSAAACSTRPFSWPMPACRNNRWRPTCGDCGDWPTRRISLDPDRSGRRPEQAA